MTEEEERQAYIAAAISYIGTPYKHMGRIKGVGVDCATLLICAALDAGLIEGEIDLPYYPADWHLHRGGERYLATMLNWTREVPPPALPGDIVIWKFARSFSHSAIVVSWPLIVHAYCGRPVCYDDAIANQMLQFVGEPGPQQNRPRPMKIFSRWSR